MLRPLIRGDEPFDLGLLLPVVVRALDVGKDGELLGDDWRDVDGREETPSRISLESGGSRSGSRTPSRTSPESGGSFACAPTGDDGRECFRSQVSRASAMKTGSGQPASATMYGVADVEADRSCPWCGRCEGCGGGGDVTVILRCGGLSWGRPTVGMRRRDVETGGI